MNEDTGAKQRLLIVDDSKVIRVTARKILRDHFETVEAVDGENAWETLNNEGPFSLIVSDLTMPNLDGFGLLKRIRGSQHPDIRDIPVIIITGSNDSEKTKHRASEAGATDFIGKPFDSVHLLARTQAHANAHVVTHALRKETFALEEQVTTDLLTELPNEVAFMDRGYQHLSYAIRHKTTLSVFLIEIDNYMELARRHGKQGIEAVIRSVVNTLNNEIRQEDIMARTGTARFGLLLSGMNIAGIHNLSERICRSVSTSPVKQDENRINVTVSAGVATPVIRRDTRLEDLLSEAARHLSIASSRGGNQAIFADSLEDEAVSVSSDPAGKATLSAEAIMEMVSGASTTEIEIGVPLAFDPEEYPADELPAIECRETTEPASLPGKFAGPVSDNPRNTVPGLSTDRGQASADPVNMRSTGQPDVPQNRAVFAVTDVKSELDETIVITAPFDIHFATDSDQAEGKNSEGRAARETSAQSTGLSTSPPKHIHAETPENKQTAARNHGNPDEVQEPPRRRGFIRRLLVALRSPFRRHRRA